MRVFLKYSEKGSWLDATPHDHASLQEGRRHTHLIWTKAGMQITIWWTVTAPYLELRTRKPSATAAVLTDIDILICGIVSLLLFCNLINEPTRTYLNGYFTQYFLQFWVYYLDVNFVCIMSCWSTVMPVRQCKYTDFYWEWENATVVSLWIFLSANSCDQKYFKPRGLSRRLSSGHTP